MADMGVVEADDKQAEFRQGEPQWHLPLEHAGPVAGIVLGAAARRFAQALTGDDERRLDATGLGAMEETQQRRVRLLLRHAVQVEARVDRLAAARDALFEPPAERRQRRRWRRRRLTRRDGMASKLRWCWRACDRRCHGRFQIRFCPRLRRFQWLNRAREAGPQSLFFIAQLPAPTHGFGFGRGFCFAAATVAVAAAGFGAGATIGFGSGSGTSTAVGSSM